MKNITYYRVISEKIFFYSFVNFLWLRVFGLLLSSLLLFLQHFDRYVLRPFSGICRTSINHNRVQVLSIPVLLLTCSQDWTCNLQMIVSLEAKGTNVYNCYGMCLARQFRVIFGTYKLNVLTWLELLLLFMIFYLCSYSDFKKKFFFLLWLMESEQVTPIDSIKEHSLKLRESSHVRQTPEEGRRTYQPKRGNNNKDEDNSLKTLNDKNHQASSQKFCLIVY